MDTGSIAELNNDESDKGFVSVDWRDERTISFRGRLVEIPHGHWTATDGDQFLYSIPWRPPVHSDCPRPEPGMVLLAVGDAGCQVAEYPALACVLSHVCEDAQGLPHDPPRAPIGTPSESSGQRYQLLAVREDWRYDTVWNGTGVHAALTRAGLQPPVEVAEGAPWEPIRNVSARIYVANNGAWSITISFLQNREIRETEAAVLADFENAREESRPQADGLFQAFQQEYGGRLIDRSWTPEIARPE